MPKVKVAELSELREGEPIERLHQDKQLCLVLVQGEVYAINNVCTHQGAPLHEGELGRVNSDPHMLTCPWHEAHFDLRTGKVRQETPWAEDTEVYEVEVRGGEVYVDL